MNTLIAAMSDDAFRNGSRAPATATRDRAAGFTWAIPGRRTSAGRPEAPNPRRKSFLRLLDPQRRHDWALLAVIREAYLTGCATRRVNGLAYALGVTGDHDEDIRLAARELDRRADEFRKRPLPGTLPYLVIDVVSQKVRDRGHVGDVSVVLVAGIDPQGNRHALTYEAAHALDEEFWLMLFAGLRNRGVGGVKMVTAEANPGLAQAVGRVFAGATWQPSGVRTLGLANEHPRRVQSVSCLASMRRELSRHCRMVGIFPGLHSLLRFVGVMLEEHHDEWLAGPRYLSPSLYDALPSEAPTGRLVLLRPA